MTGREELFHPFAPSWIVLLDARAYFGSADLLVGSCGRHEPLVLAESVTLAGRTSACPPLARSVEVQAAFHSLRFGGRNVYLWKTNYKAVHVTSGLPTFGEVAASALGTVLREQRE